MNFQTLTDDCVLLVKMALTVDKELAATLAAAYGSLLAGTNPDFDEDSYIRACKSPLTEEDVPRAMAMERNQINGVKRMHSSRPEVVSLEEVADLLNSSASRSGPLH